MLLALLYQFPFFLLESLWLLPDLALPSSNHTASDQQTQICVVTLAVYSSSRLSSALHQELTFLGFLKLFSSQKMIIHFVLLEHGFHIFSLTSTLSSPNDPTYMNTTEHHLVSCQQPVSMVTLRTFIDSSRKQ